MSKNEWENTDQWNLLSALTGPGQGTHAVPVLPGRPYVQRPARSVRRGDQNLCSGWAECWTQIQGWMWVLYHSDDLVCSGCTFLANKVASGLVCVPVHFDSSGFFSTHNLRWKAHGLSLCCTLCLSMRELQFFQAKKYHSVVLNTFGSTASVTIPQNNVTKAHWRQAWRFVSATWEHLGGVFQQMNSVRTDLRSMFDRDSYWFNFPKQQRPGFFSETLFGCLFSLSPKHLFFFCGVCCCDRGESVFFIYEIEDSLTTRRLVCRHCPGIWSESRSLHRSLFPQKVGGSPANRIESFAKLIESRVRTQISQLSFHLWQKVCEGLMLWKRRVSV